MSSSDLSSICEEHSKLAGEYDRVQLEQAQRGDQSSGVLASKMRIVDALRITNDNSWTDEVNRLMEESPWRRSFVQLSRQKDSLERKLTETSEALALQLPTFEESELGGQRHLFRGTLLRRLRFVQIEGNSVIVTNNHPNESDGSVNSTLDGFHTAAMYAIRGAFDPIYQDQRVDPVVLVMPYSEELRAACGVTKDWQSHYNIPIAHLCRIKGVRLYYPGRVWPI
ncbi:MAG: hypothetical protein AAB383_01205 [Patescibacteria group bacterium]